MLDKKDINKYTNTGRVPTGPAEDELAIAAGATAKTMGSMIGKALLTVFFIISLAGLLVLASVASFIWSLRGEEIPALNTIKLNFSSNIYIKDRSGNDMEYMLLHREQNRTWVDYVDIPQAMKDAQVAIEDKRFYDHNGVDWNTTLGAVFKMATGNGGAGGSTITQQLIKNVTQQDEVSILRKIKEIFRAMNLEENYTKEEILEYYLNLVHYGSGADGVQAAANLYFGKDIKDCSIAECAAIAGITQNPYAFSPINYPEKTKERQKIVLDEMLGQEYITKAEYDEAMVERENMRYAFKASETGETEEVKLDSNDVWDWHTETLFKDLVSDLMEQKNYSYDLAVQTVYNSGLSIYSTVNMDIQRDVDRIMQDSANIIGDSEIKIGFFLMDYNGSVIAVGGSKDKKEANRIWNHAIDTERAPGSSIKPLSVYSPALDAGVVTYGTVLKDSLLKDYYGPGEDGPYNYTRSDMRGYMNVDKAIEMSQNIPAADAMLQTGIGKCFNFMLDRFHFSTLDAAHDQDKAPMATGGLYNGATVREMTAAFATFGNGGNYYKPYTYYYVLDHDGNVLLDNRSATPSRAMSEVNANIMNKLLHTPIYGIDNNGGEATGKYVQIDGLDIYGKTGTTDEIKDLWFVGGTPYGVAGIWTGYDPQRSMNTEMANKEMWRAIISHIWENYWSQGEARSFSFSEDMVSRIFCRSSGYLASNSCGNTGNGWYDVNNMPKVCNGGSDHTKMGAKPNVTAAPSSTPEASAAPESPTPEPSVTPTPPDVTPEPITPTPNPITPTPAPITPTPVPVTPTPEPAIPTPPPPTDPPVVTPTPPPSTDPPEHVPGTL